MNPYTNQAFNAPGPAARSFQIGCPVNTKYGPGYIVNIFKKHNTVCATIIVPGKNLVFDQAYPAVFQTDSGGELTPQQRYNIFL